MFYITTSKTDSNFFLPFPKINQKLIGHDAAHHPSIHPSIHVTIIIQPPCCLLQKRSFISIDSFNHYTASTILDPLLLRPTVFHQLFLLLLLLPHPREKFRSFISHFPSTQRTLHSPSSILLEYLDRRLLFVPLLCFSMSRATVMDAFTCVRGNNQSLPAAPPNTQEKPECL